jgi:hypothetical protein
LFKGYGAKVGLGNMRVKAENRMVTILYYPLAIRIYKSYSLFKNIPFIRLNIKVSIGVLFLTTPALLDFQ